jgi:hypothetical protein
MRRLFWLACTLKNWECYKKENEEEEKKMKKKETKERCNDGPVLQKEPKSHFGFPITWSSY